MSARVLIVEDNPSQAKALLNVLEAKMNGQPGPVLCRSEMSAIAALTETPGAGDAPATPFDLVVLDLSIPIIAPGENLPKAGVQASCAHFESLWKDACGARYGRLAAANISLKVSADSFHHAGVRLAAIALEQGARQVLIYSAIDMRDALGRLGVVQPSVSKQGEQREPDMPLDGVEYYFKIADDGLFTQRLKTALGA